MNDSTHNRAGRLLRNASWLFGASTIASLTGFLQAIVLGRTLGADGYGLLGIVIVFATVVNQLIDIRLWETVTKFVGEHHARGEDGHARAVVKFAFVIDLVTGILAFGVVIAVAPVACTRVLGRPEAVPLISLYAISLLVATVNQTAMAVLRVFDRFRWLGIERVSFHVVRFVALTIVAITTGELVPILWTYVATDFLRAAVLIVFAFRTARVELVRPGPDHLGLLRPRLGEFLSFTAHNAVTMVLSFISRQIDILILAAFGGDAEVGYYRMARNFAQLLLRLVDPVYQAIYPELVRMREEASAAADLHGLIAYTMRRVMLFIVPATVAIEVLAPWLIDVSVGPDFAPAAAAVRIMAIGVVVSAALLWARPLALTAGRPEISTAAFAAGAVVLLAASAWLVPTHGYMGSAAVYLLSMSTTAGISAIGAARATRRTQRIDA